MLQYKTRDSHAGIELWGDMWSLKELHTFVSHLAGDSPLLKDSGESNPLWSFAYEIRHAFVRMRHTSTRNWYGEDITPIYGFDCLWTDLLVVTGLLRASLGFLPSARDEQAILYQFESVIEVAITETLPADPELYFCLARDVGSRMHIIDQDAVNSRTGYFLSLTPAKRRKLLLPIMATLIPHQPLPEEVPDSAFLPYMGAAEYPKFKW